APRGRRLDVKRAHVHLARGLHAVLGLRRHPHRALRRHEPRGVARVDRHHAARREDELEARVLVPGDLVGGGQIARHGPHRPRHVLVGIALERLGLSHLRQELSVGRVTDASPGARMRGMNNNRGYLVPFINLGHFVDHLAMLVFPTVVVALAREWNQPYSELLPMALGGFIAFGAFALPAGWLADHWSRYKMMAVFF